MADPITTDPRASRYAAILDAAGRLFLTQGFAGTTTLDIARAAGVSKRDLYAAFTSKEAMLEALIAGRVTTMAGQVRLETPGSRGEVMATLEGFASRLLGFLVSPEVIALYRLAIAHADRQPEVGRLLLSAGIEATTVHVRDYMRGAMAAGFLAIDDADLAARTFLSVAIGQTQMRRLLDTALPTPTPAERLQAVAAAIRCLRALERP
jgi:AcrR family transcriptional regulator